MGADPEFDALLATVSNRVECIELLAGEGSTPPRDIVDALPDSRATVHRALRELRDADLVEKSDDGYTATPAGVMAAREYRRYETASRAILSAEDLLTPIPEAHAPPTAMLVDAKTVRADAEVPVRALEAVSNRVQRADRIRAFLPTLINTHFLWDWHRAVVTTSVDGAAIFDPDLLTVLKGQYPHLLSEMAAANGFAAFSADGPPYGLLYTTSDDTTAVTVIVYEETTGVRGILTNEAPAAVEWARAALERLERDATEVTVDLDALSPAVTDGMAQLRPSNSRPGQSQSAEVEPKGTSANQGLPIDLEAEGFVRLSETYFDTHGQASPAVSWRTGFSLAEVRAGHAVDRLDGDGRNLTRRLVEALRDGTDQVVLGPPGAGKSTVCMSVACEWEDRALGPVLYREMGSGSQFASTAQLEAYLRHTDGHALVVVEDAIREEVREVFTVMRTLESDSGVTFLLDARTYEWRDTEAFDIDPRLDAFRRSHVETVNVPELDEEECERFVTKFASLVDADFDLSGVELVSMINEGRSVEEGSVEGDSNVAGGDALVVQHYLLQRYDPPVDETAAARTALVDDVRQTYRRVADAETLLPSTLAGLIALLTAAGVPVAEEYLFAIGSADEFGAIDEARERLVGHMLFEQERIHVGGPSTYRTRHETWATHFLEQMLALEPEHRVQDQFEQCVTDLLALADQPDRRKVIQRQLDGRTPHLHRIEADPQAWADEVVERIFRVGQRNGTLAPLFGETEDGGLQLPASCSPWTRLQLSYWRGQMNRSHGDLVRAEQEFRTLGKLALEVDLPAEVSSAPPVPAFTSNHAIGDDDLPAHRARWRAASWTNLGLVARDRGDYEAAYEYHREALALCREIGDRGGEATNLRHLGFAAYFRSDYTRALEYLEQSLAIAEELDARRIEAASCNQLGLVARERGEYELAQEYQERGRDIARDLDDRYWEAATLGGLGEVATERGAYDEAQKYAERSLGIARDFGFKYGETTFLNNLGIVARKHGAIDEAREYHEHSLAINREIGAKHGEATSHKNLGIVARLEGRLEEAEEHLELALAELADTDDRGGWGQVRLEQGRIALAQDIVETARERARTARKTFTELGARHWTGRSTLLLGRVAAADDDPETARKHWQTAFETFEAVGAPQDALATLELLIETCRSVGDEEAARQWCRKALELVDDAPESTTVHHRDWVEHHASELLPE